MSLSGRDARGISIIPQMPRFAYNEFVSREADFASQG
jgi:hypothetical protein